MTEPSAILGTGDVVWLHVMAEKDRRQGVKVDGREVCEVAWPDAGGAYMDGHACDRADDHKGRHRCSCGATKYGSGTEQR